MLYYEYPVLYKTFFESLGIQVILSDKTNQNILNNGIKNSIDESCLASKIYIGHIVNLIEKSKSEHLDYIFIPRVSFFGKKETVCVKFYALYDICKNIFDFKFIDLNIDYKKGENELIAFLKLGKKLNKSITESFKAYNYAKNKQRKYNIANYIKQNKLLNNEKIKKRVLIVSHPYIQYDNYMGKPLIDFLLKNNLDIIYSDINSSKIYTKENKKNKYKNISKSIYWKYNKDLLNGIVEFKEKIDGIIYISVFPCGTDALSNDIAIRKINNIPTLNIILDEQNASAGIITRLESFLDILESNEKVVI